MPLRALILNNFWLKLFSLFFATLIYFAIDAKSPQSLFPSRLPTLELRCAISVLTSPGNRANFIVQPSTVIVKVRAEETVLKKLVPESIPAYIKLTDMPQPAGLFRVEVSLPRNVTLEEVVPDQVSVQPAAQADK